MYKRILIATDGSRLSRTAIAHGVALAKATGGTVVGFHMRQMPQPSFYGESAVMLPPDIQRYLEKQAAEAADKCLADVEAAAKKAGVSYEGLHSIGESPAETIVEAAKKHKCDVIVMASHGRRGMSRLLIGSETSHVLIHTELPVLVVR